MTGRPWTRDELSRLATDRQVTARSRAGAEIDVPAWLLAHGRLWPYSSSETLAMMHPDDRGILVDGFLNAVTTPGEPVTVTYRSRIEGEWHRRECTWLDLTDQPEVGAVMAFSHRIEGTVEVAHIDEDQSGEHALTNWMVWTVSDAGFIGSVEGASAALLGYEPEELIGRRTLEFLAGDTMSDTVELWASLHGAPGNTATARRRLTRRDGTLIWTDTSLLNRPGRTGDDAVLMVVWDATSAMAKEQALHDQAAELHRREREAVALAEDFQMLADEVPAAVFRCDPCGTLVFHNARWSELIGAHQVSHLQDIVAADERPGIDAMLAALAHSDTAQRLSREVPNHDGTRVWQVNLRCVGDGESRNLLGSIEDVTLTAHFRREAHHDTLTGLLNRGAILERVAADLRADADATLVLFVDLDGFKDVNDTLGHDAGDTVLVEVARRLTAGLRPGDAVGRFGGDEFIIVCPDPDGDGAAIADRLTAALGDRIDLGGSAWEPAASIGWARGRQGDDVADVLRRADRAMYDRKRVRKGGVPVAQAR